MKMNLPLFVQVIGIQDPVIHFKWDDWNVEQSDMPIDRLLKQQLQDVSHRAAAALTISTAEWVVYRFATMFEDPKPSFRLEAAWAQVVDPRYSSLSDIPLEEWRGPVRGPIGIALRRVIFALEQAWKGHDPVWRACRASKLAEHVLPNPVPFVRWREAIIERLRTFYPLQPEDMLGDAVPRECMDPNYNFDSNQTEALINQFLLNLDYKLNPFLNSPSTMLEAGFVGTPYLFSQEADRKVRYNW
jgi:hypothetical protein